MSDSSNSYGNDTAAPSTNRQCSAPRSRESSTKKKHKEAPPAKHWSTIGIGMPSTKKHLKQTPPNAKHKKEARPKVIAPPKKAKKHKDVETIAAPPPHFEAPHPLQFGGIPSSNRRETDQTRASDAAAFAKWQASAAKAAASEETNMNEQEKSGESSDSESYVTFGSPAPKKKQKVLKDGPNDSAEKEEREDATSASIGATASGAQEQKTRCVLKEAPTRRRDKIKKNEEAKEKQGAKKSRV